MKLITVRGLDKETEARLREVARTRNLSLNKAALALLRKGAGLREPQEGPAVVGDALDRFARTWSEERTKEFRDATADLERIDESMWR